MYKIRTVDVWDTLLRRDCHPECIKLTTAAHLLLGWAERLKPAFHDQWALYRARLEAERFLGNIARREGRDDEYRIHDVFRQWLGVVMANEVEVGIVAHLVEFELSVEIERSYRDPEIHDFLAAHTADHTFFLSDFYMDSMMLKRLLDAKGLTGLVADGLSSCDMGFNKRSGRLFSHVHVSHCVEPHEHVHIGDNEWSDVESASRLGVRAIHYLPAKAHAERCERERLFASREVLFQYLHAQALDMADVRASVMNAQAGAAFRLGVEAAPLFIGFALSIAEQSVSAGLDKLFFLTREGEFFLRVFRVLFPTERVAGHTLPRAELLEVSRLSTFAASLEALSVDELARIWRLFRTQPVSGLFATLGVEIEPFSELLAAVGLSPEQVVERPESHPAVRRLMAAPAFREAALSAIAAQRDLLLAYLNQRGFVGGGSVGVVDIGWRGSIQDNLAYLINGQPIDGFYLGLRKPLNPQPVSVRKFAYVADERQEIRHNKLFEAFAVIEMLCASPKGSVEGYVQTDDGVQAVRHVIVEENVAFERFANFFQDGVALAAEVWQPYLERYAVMSGELRVSAQRVWEVLNRSPTPQLAQLFFETPQHDLFGFGDLYRRNQVPSMSTIVTAPFRRGARREVLDFVRRVQWTSGIKHLQGVGPVHRQTLVALFTAANLAKRYRMKARRGR